MITIAGFNSSIDRVMRASRVHPGEVSRVSDVRAGPGGKGLHAALTCAILGAAVRLVGIVDALNRRRFEDVLGDAGIEFCGIEVPDEIRTCIAVHDALGGVTELLEPGPVVDQDTADRLVRAVVAGASDGPILLSGSLPRGMGPEIYGDLVRATKRAASPCLVDTSGEPLRLALVDRPDVVSPNREEAEGVTAVRIGDTTSAAAAAVRLTQAGAGTAVISLGHEGIVASDGQRACHVVARQSSAGHVVGAGDSLVGAMAVAMERGLDFERTLRFAVACASASVEDPTPGRLRLEDLARMEPLVQIEWLHTADIPETPAIGPGPEGIR